MTDYVHLFGAEDVRRAGSRMMEAAEKISQAVSSLDDVLFRHRLQMEDWLQRFEAALREKA